MEKALFDTSVLVAGLVSQHPRHGRAFPWLKRVAAGEVAGLVATHSLAELYAVLTSLPVRPRISPGAARRLIRETVESSFQVVQLTARDYRDVLDSVAELGLAGGVVYDALAARIAEKAGVDQLLTFNPSDFRRSWPRGGHVIQEP